MINENYFHLYKLLLLVIVVFMLLNIVLGITNKRTLLIFFESFTAKPTIVKMKISLLVYLYFQFK